MSNRKILINRKPIEGPWGGGNNFVRALHKFAPKYGFQPVHEFSDDIDLIFMIDPRYDDLGISIREIAAYKQFKPDTRVIYRINECDQRKGTNQEIDPLVQAAGQITDICFFISSWIANYHINDQWGCRLNPVVYSGTNTEHFCPRPRWDNGKINLVTHHWSDNPLKGQDVYEMIDQWLPENPGFTFTYIGRTKSKFQNSRVIAPMFGMELGKELSKYDVYISASRFDPGPNHIIESLACGIPTYTHEDSGGAAEQAGSSHVYRDFEHLLGLIANPQQNNGIVPVCWEKCIDKYFAKVLQLF